MDQIKTNTMKQDFIYNMIDEETSNNLCEVNCLSNESKKNQSCNWPHILVEKKEISQRILSNPKGLQIKRLEIKKNHWGKKNIRDNRLKNFSNILLQKKLRI